MSKLPPANCLWSAARPVQLLLALACLVGPAGLHAAAAQQRNAAVAQAGQTFQLGKFGDWQAVMAGKDRSKVCYALAQPKDRRPAGLKRDPAYLFISNRASDGTKNEVAVKLGFAGAANKDGVLTVGSARFVLLAKAEDAFLKNPAQEAQLIEAMKKAPELTIRVSSARGNETTDRYSLDGFARALERMARECP